MLVVINHNNKYLYVVGPYASHLCSSYGPIYIPIGHIIDIYMRAVWRTRTL